VRFPADVTDSLIARLLLLALVAAFAVVAGLWLRRRDGRDHAVQTSEVLTSTDLGGAALGERATLVQLSSAFCAPCRQARAVLGRLAAATLGVAHVELDAEHNLDLVRRLDVRRTPTVLVLDAAGRVVRRASGAPTLEQAAHALAAAVPQAAEVRGG